MYRKMGMGSKYVRYTLLSFRNIITGANFSSFLKHSTLQLSSDFSVCDVDVISLQQFFLCHLITQNDILLKGRSIQRKAHYTLQTKLLQVRAIVDTEHFLVQSKYPIIIEAKYCNTSSYNFENKSTAGEGHRGHRTVPG